MKIKMKHSSIEITINWETKACIEIINYQQAQRSNQTTRYKQPLPKQYTKHKKNPCDCSGIQLRCLIAQNLDAQNCPETRNQDTFFSQEVVLLQADYDHPAKLKNLVPESRNSAILDSGASNMVTGENHGWVHVLKA